MKLTMTLLCAALSSAALLTQEAPQPSSSNPPSSTAKAPGPAEQSAADSKSKGIPSFLIIGTVFDERALSLPGAQVRIRRADQKKFRWETYTNSRGEFAVRVLPGYQYEVLTSAKKYQDQSKMVDAKVDVQQRLSIKLEPAGGGKAGAKP